MITKDLAKFYGISPQAVNNWLWEKRRKKIIQAEAGAEPQITNLIGEINQLAYVFDCQNLQGELQVSWCTVHRLTFELRTTIYKVSAPVFSSVIDLNAPDALPRLLGLKKYLMEMVYGAQKID